MQKNHIKFLIGFLILPLFLLPQNVFGASCGADGFTVVYVNGIFTPDKDVATQDKETLEDKFKEISNIKDVKFLTTHNQSHLGGVGDLYTSGKQAYQERSDKYIVDHDLTTILNQIHTDVKTQKILLVGHSQGTFYTNEAYDYLVANGVPKESISVYNVATPAYYVSGDGKHITSNTDSVIDKTVRYVTQFGHARQPLKANVTINLSALPSPGREGNGHGFSDTYLAGASGRIIPEINTALQKLAVNGANTLPDGTCFTPPGETLVYKAVDITLAVADPVAGLVIEDIKDKVDNAVTIYKAGKETAYMAYDAAVTVYDVTTKAAYSAGVVTYDAYDAAKTATAKAIDSVNAQLKAMKEIASINIDSMVSNAKNNSAGIANYFKNAFANTDVEPSELTGSISGVITGFDDAEQNPGQSFEPRYSAELLAELAAQLTPIDIKQKKAAETAAEIAEAEEARKKYLAAQAKKIQAQIFQLEMENTLNAIAAQRAEAEVARTVLAIETASEGADDASAGTVFVEAAEEAPKVRAGRAGHKNPPEAAEDSMAVTEIENFEASYDSTRLEISFSWDALAGPAIVKIKDETTGEFIFETDSETSFVHIIYEVARDYNYSIRAYDAEGTELAMADALVVIPSFINDPALFSADRYIGSGITSGANFIEFYFDDYPFLPIDLVYTPEGVPGMGLNRKMMVFYFNKDAPQHEFLDNTEPHLEDMSEIIFTSTIGCSSPVADIHASLEIPDGQFACPSGGTGFYSIDYDHYLVEGDNHLLFDVGRQYGGFIQGFTYIFAPSDYFTTAFYGFYRDTNDGSTPPEDATKMYKLLAVDNTRHYFQTGAPEHESPTTPGNPEYSFDEAGMFIIVSFEGSADPDTTDSLIRYEISLDDGATWNSIVSGGSVTVQADTTYQIQLRAADDFNLKSEAVETELIVPAVSP